VLEYFFTVNAGHSVPSTLESLPLRFWLELHDVRFVWQAAALLTCLAFAGALTWYTRRRLDAAAGPGGERGLAGLLRRLVFPLSALLMVLSARALLAGHGVSLLNVAVPLLTALAIIRTLAYMLHLVFAHGDAVAAFERTIAWLVWTGFALHVLGLAPAILAFFDDIGLQVGKQRISLLAVGQAALWIVVTLLLTLWLSRLAETRLMAAQRMEMTLRVMLAKLLRPVLVLFALLMVLPAVGIDLTALSVFGGALGVGIGFGLQKIASNYISGFIILLDHSVKIGDIVTIEKHSGRLNKMTARYVVVRGGDGTEAIIPNETVITSTVINHSYSDPLVCVAIPVQIAYSSDLDAAIAVLLAAARAHERALATPEPRVSITAFGDNGIQLELGVWIRDPEQGGAALRSDIYHAVWREFRAKGIEIPCPQRAVRLLGGSAPAV
jgi:small-conductance mechanosensitive channel